MQKREEIEIMNKGSKLLWTGALALSLVGCSSGTSDTSASAGRKKIGRASCRERV